MGHLIQHSVVVSSTKVDQVWREGGKRWGAME